MFLVARWIPVAVVTLSLILANTQAFYIKPSPVEKTECSEKGSENQKRSVDEVQAEIIATSNEDSPTDLTRTSRSVDKDKAHIRTCELTLLNSVNKIIDQITKSMKTTKVSKSSSVFEKELIGLTSSQKERVSNVDRKRLKNLAHDILLSETNLTVDQLITKRNEVADLTKEAKEIISILDQRLRNIAKIIVDSNIKLTEEQLEDIAREITGFTRKPVDLRSFTNGKIRNIAQEISSSKSLITTELLNRIRHDFTGIISHSGGIDSTNPILKPSLNLDDRINTHTIKNERFRNIAIEILGSDAASKLTSDQLIKIAQEVSGIPPSGTKQGEQRSRSDPKSGSFPREESSSRRDPSSRKESGSRRDPSSREDSSSRRDPNSGKNPSPSRKSDSKRNSSSERREKFDSVSDDGFNRDGELSDPRDDDHSERDDLWDYVLI